jgi:hypothetical protein
MANNSLLAKGSKSGLYWKEETALGDAPTGNWNACPVTSEGFSENIATVSPNDIRADRRKPMTRGGNKADGGSISNDFGILRSLTWFRHLLAGGNAAAGSTLTPAALAISTAYNRGDYVTSGANTYVCIVGGTTNSTGVVGTLTTTSGRQNVAGATSTILVFEFVSVTSGNPLYTHTITAGVDWPAVGIAFEKQIKGGTADLFLKFLGGRFNSFSLNVPQQGIITSTWNVLNLSGERGGSSGIGTPVYPSDRVAIGYNAYVHLNGDLQGTAGRPLNSFSMDINNGADENVYVMGQRNREEIPEGTRTANGRFSTYFKDATEYDYLINESKIALALTIIEKGAFFKIEFPECILTGDSTPKVSGQGIVTADFEWNAGSETGNFDCKITAVTGVQNPAN